ncbi:permease-like cell division protein FtsX [Embleya sp. NBC_00896]|uniref:permease-like cell division protein FtsX n=1 Tax=Embleya sp. NBC_00896 TaxID=2975961 RepID=UPI002F917D24|nr:permease-like cell division protein FtsX [Embleya sp. NBC_00896]
MANHHTSRAGRVVVGCAAALLAITTAAACSGGHDKPRPKRAEVDSPAPAGSAETDADDATEDAEDDLPPPGVDYWAGKADLAVFLCQTSDPKTGGCADGPVTDTQREATLAALRALPQVQHVYFEDRQQAWKLFRAQSANTLLGDTITAAQLPESFRVKLKDRGTLPIVVSAMEGHPGVASTMTHAPTAPGAATPPRSGTALPLTQERARRAVPTADDVGPEWSADTLTDTGPKPASEPYSGSSGNAGCDRALAGAPTGRITITLGAQRMFQDRNGLRLTATVQVYEGDSAALQLAKTRALLAGCADLPLPMQGTTVRFHTLPAPTLGDETLGMRLVLDHNGPKTVDSIMVRMGPNIAAVTVSGDPILPSTTLEQLARRAAEHLHAAVSD